MLKKVQWHENLTADEKITIYKTVLAILERADNSMDFNDFMLSIWRHVDFSKEEVGESLLDLCAIVQELINRSYIRLELQDFDTSTIGDFVPLINVVRI